MDYTELRQAGIRRLERLAGRVWTDFNVHDPGITLLEQLCYALAELGYRIDHELPDHLASSGGTAAAGLWPADEILSSRAVTPTDLRQLALSVPGVKNVWIEPFDGDEIALYYHPGREELYHPTPRTGRSAAGTETEPPPAEPVRIDGLHRVLIETSDLHGGSTVRARVARCLHAHRNLCEDFAAVEVLKTQWIRVRATVEIDAVEDAEALSAEIRSAIEASISPSVPFHSLEERLAGGATLDELFDGPRLGPGFVDAAALAAAPRRTALNASDLVHAITDVPQVRAVRGLRLESGQRSEAWSLALDADKAPKLESAAIRLERAGHVVAVDPSRLAAAQVGRAARTAGRGGRPDPLAVPAGRDRDVGRYDSVQHHLPTAYGLGPAGLPASATPERQVRARQLEAYLLFFDQLLADAFAQLEHAGELLSFGSDDLRTYFAGRLDEPSLRLDSVRGPGHQDAVRALTEDDDDPGAERKNRFLNHLLARVAEQLTDYSLMLFDALPAGESGAGARLARDKLAFLRSYPRLSSARGTAASYLEEPGAGNRSGLEERVRRKLGLADDEETLLIEHLLLRPMAQDTAQQVPLLAATPSGDPFSCQLSFIFHLGPRLAAASDGFRRFAEATVRAETPAHLVPQVRWLAGDAWTALRDAWHDCLDRRRRFWASELGGADHG